MLAENYCNTRAWSLVLALQAAGLFGELYYGESDQMQEFKGGFPPPESSDNWRTAELAMRRGHRRVRLWLRPKGEEPVVLATAGTSCPTRSATASRPTGFRTART